MAVPFKLPRESALKIRGTPIKAILQVLVNLGKFMKKDGIDNYNLVQYLLLFHYYVLR